MAVESLMFQRFYNFTKHYYKLLTNKAIYIEKP